ncbi:MAG: DUF1573 domain-containing protein [Muribaculaceae bacterium]|nr:DUF1573 domain-containing protein [Muribaculaceae bacterium]MDE7096965.1 DUF1573 domain-containing protein [Muribaculaceae bacterium]
MKNNLLPKGRSMPCTVILITIVLGIALSAYCQIEKSLEFIPGVVDFGIIREEDGKVSREVKAVNISSDSTYIISARTSCGCSEVEYSQDMIAPGDTAYVTVTYDPNNRPGKFLKTVKFFTGEDRISNSVKLSGIVIPSRENIDEAYPFQAGRLRLSALLVNAGEVSRKEARPLFVGIYNDSEHPVTLVADTRDTALEVTLTPDIIEPFGVSTLTMMLKGRLFKGDETDFLYKTFIKDALTGDTVVCIPVGGTIKSNI